MNNKHTHFIILLFMFGKIICGSAVSAAKPMQACAGIPPVAYLVERIGGENVQVEAMIQPGQDPHTYELSPKQVHSLSKATLFFKVGMPFEERLLEKILKVQKRLTVVDTAANIKKLKASSCNEHDHGKETKTDHGCLADIDPHVWLSPPNLKIQAANIATALEKADKEHLSEYRANLLKLEKDLDALQEKIAQRLKPFAGHTMYVFHPAFGYFADCYGLKQEAVQVGGKQPSPKQLRQLIHQAQEAKVKVIFVQPQFDSHCVDTIAESIGGKVVPLNDMSKDVLANLLDISENVKKGMEE
jgi:zinc transport system substrate-binding protein